MSRYEFIFTIHPSGAFGLPEDGVLVVPEDLKPLRSPEFDHRTNRFLTYGTQPVYREIPLEIEFGAKGIDVDFHDNRFRFNLQAESDEEAITAANRFASEICLALTALHGGLFHASGYQVVKLDDQHILPTSKHQSLFKVRRYNVDRLRQSIEKIPLLIESGDDRLFKSAAYFAHGIFLETEAEGLLSQTPDFLDTPHAFHSRLVVSDVLLNYYKACTTIVGDPSQDRDHQSRYRDLGVAKTTYRDINTLKELRDDYDVAHHAVEWDKLEEARPKMEFAFSVAHKTLGQYSRHLAGKSPDI